MERTGADLVGGVNRGDELRVLIYRECLLR